MPDYSSFGPALLAVLGGALPWLRQFKAVGDRWIALIAVALAGFAWALLHPFGHDLRYELIVGIIGVAGYMSSFVGGGAITTRASDSVAAIPKPNSR